MYRKLLLITFCINIFNYAQTFQWVKTSATDITTNPSYLTSPLAVDNNGNPVSAHLFHNREIYGSAYFGDHVITRRNTAGVTMWTINLMGKANIQQLMYDNQGYLYGAGTFRDSIYFNQSMVIHNTMINDEGFVFRMDASGNPLWLKRVSQLSSSIYYETSITLGTNGTFWIASSDDQLNSNLKKFDNNGNLLSTITQTNVRYIGSASVDVSGNIWVTGSTFNGPVSFNGYSSAAPFIYTEYIVKYNSAGVCQWVRYVEDVTLQRFKIATDNSGGAYWSGNLMFPAWFGNIQAMGPRWVYDFFVTRIDAGGNFLWLREVPYENTLGDASVGNGDFVSYSGDDGVYVIGFIRNTVNFGNGITVSSYGYQDVLILKYSSSGSLMWANHAGGSSSEEGCSVAADQQGGVYMSGKILATSHFDTITVNASGLTAFLAKISDAFVPVELVSFTANIINEQVQLSWSTASEKNNKGFEIERQNINGTPVWETVGFVEGGGTTTQNNSYIFNDNPLAGKYKYRLKQIDYDGSFSFTEELEIDLSLPQQFALYQNYPNPFNPSTSIKFAVPGNAGVVSLRIYDALGNLISELLNEVVPAGAYEKEFTLNRQASGIYYYRLMGNGFSETRKMTLMK